MELTHYFNNKHFWFIYRKFKDKVDWYEISKQKLSIDFIKKFKDNVIIGYYLNSNKVDESILEELIKLYNFKNDWDSKYFWENVVKFQNVSENFLNKYYDYIDKSYIYICKKVSEDFIENHLDTVHWGTVSSCQVLSEQFIEKYKDLVVWDNISQSQILSEEFIERHLDNINWNYISSYQHLSEDFIIRHLNKLNLKHVLFHQKLSNEFILIYFDDFDFNMFKNIIECQKLNDEIIAKLINKQQWFIKDILKYQNISDNILNKFKYLKSSYRYEYNLYNKNSIYSSISDNWLYKSEKYKKKKLKKTGLYECYNDYFIAYKAIRRDRYSIFNFQYKYEPGKIYETKCDCTCIEDSFGFNVGTYNYAKNFGGNNSIIIKCKIKYEDIGRIIHDGYKIRCSKLEVLN